MTSRFPPAPVEPDNAPDELNFIMSLYIHIPDVSVVYSIEKPLAVVSPNITHEDIISIYNSAFNALHDQHILPEEYAGKPYLTECILYHMKTGEIIASTGRHSQRITAQRILYETTILVDGLGSYLFSNCADYKDFEPTSH